MKDESFMSWLKGQNEHARATIAGIPGRDRIAARLNEVTTAVASVTTPRRAHWPHVLPETPTGRGRAEVVRARGRQRASAG